ncbi:MaoC/PaaZ C-terminal domain-containing protein [Pigmentiphaga soli]|uniref:MaoC/PaaZ C-terminal domain-containing protein n=1 Tax=Pigmentiphaga soli TaxID=1007095 RepID=A0ABP8GX65_9BURK
MAIDYEKLLAWRIADARHSYTLRDTLLYALSVGLGADPEDERQLDYVYERDLSVLPSMATVLASPSGWMRDPETGINPVGTLAIDQAFEIHAPIPVAGTVIGKSRVSDVRDLGPERGALICTERTVHDEATGKPLFTARQSSLARKDGGFGGPAGPAGPRHDMPAREPDFVCELPTADNAALLFRLHNKLDPKHPDAHADPALARKLGHRRPIVHGLYTFGIACHALLRTACDYDAARLRSMAARFTAVAYPGDVLRTEIWRDGNVLSFQCRAAGGAKPVLSNGRAELA